jgi:hypothetical protein
MVQTSIPSSSDVRFVKAASPKQFMHTALQKTLKKLLFSVLRIRDVYPGYEFFPSRIPDPKFFHPTKNLSILTQKSGF